MSQLVNESTKLSVTLTVAQFNAIMAAVQELPAKIANPISQAIVEQTTKQIDEINQGGGQNLEVNITDSAATKEQFS